jgi:hypothetical protein
VNDSTQEIDTFSVAQAVLGAGPQADVLPSSDSEAAAPQGTQPPKQYSKQQIGKMRRQFITKEYGVVKACGHKFHPTNEPRTNCDGCWEAFFRVHEGVVSGAQAIVATFGEAQLVKARGKEFVKRFKYYAILIEQEQRNEASLAAMQEEVKESNVETQA